MNIVRGVQDDILDESVVTLGMFDGVHLGHQALLHACRQMADTFSLPAVELTYEPHPSRILRPELPVALLTPLEEQDTS